MLVIGLIGCTWLLPEPIRAATITADSIVISQSVPEPTIQRAQWLEQELQDWRQRRDLIDAQILDIDARLKDPALTEAERKALENQKWRLKQERDDADEWIKRIFEYLIHIP